MENFVLDARQHLDTADALKPYEECPERAAIEAQIALAYAILAVVERLDGIDIAVERLVNIIERRE